MNKQGVPGPLVRPMGSQPSEPRQQVPRGPAQAMTQQQQQQQQQGPPAGLQALQPGMQQHLRQPPPLVHPQQGMQPPQQSQQQYPRPQAGPQRLSALDIFAGLEPAMNQQDMSQREQENQRPQHAMLGAVQQQQQQQQAQKPLQQQQAAGAPAWPAPGQALGQQPSASGTVPARSSQAAAGVLTSAADNGHDAKRPRLNPPAGQHKGTPHSSMPASRGTPAAYSRPLIPTAGAPGPGPQPQLAPGTDSIAAGPQQPALSSKLHAALPSGRQLMTSRLPVARLPARAPKNLLDELMEDELVSLDDM